jgi:hypothetical protein
MYAGYEPRGPLKRFVMSAAKGIVRVEESALRFRNMSEPAGLDRSVQTTNSPVVGAEGGGAVRRRLPDERRGVPHHFSVGGGATDSRCACWALFVSKGCQRLDPRGPACWNIGC